MTLSSDWDETEEVNAVTAIPGYSENSSSGGKAANSAIPQIFDSWFHGDFRRQFPQDLSSALGSKSLEEYSRTFPNFRVNTAVEIGFDTDGQNISSYEVQMAEPSEAAPITLEGGPGEPNNPFRGEYDFDGSNDYLPSNQKGPKTDQKTVTVEKADGTRVEGVRGAIIFGGNDSYLVRAKKEGVTLALLASGNTTAAAANFFTTLPAFYSFVDFVFMADGTKIVRVWDASFYPAHALYVGGIRRDRTPFDEGEQWTRDGANSAFVKFARDSVTPGRTPFNNVVGSSLYKRLYMDGYGDHPAMNYFEEGSTLSASTVENQLSVPFFPQG